MKHKLCNLNIYSQSSKIYIILFVPNKIEIVADNHQFVFQTVARLSLSLTMSQTSIQILMIKKKSAIAQCKRIEIDSNLVSNTILRETSNFIIPKNKSKQKGAT